MTGNTRPIEASIRTDFRDEMDYGSYLELDALLSAQHPMSDPPHHDELLFIIQHQTTELWLKLVLHELRAVRGLLDSRRPVPRAQGPGPGQAHPAHPDRAVVGAGHPHARASTRSSAARSGSSSGFQSHQYRAVEFILGNKNAGMLRCSTRPARGAGRCWRSCWTTPPSTTRSCGCWPGAAIDVPAEILDRDVTQAWAEQPGAGTRSCATIYEDPHGNWALYEACEDLVDIEDAFQLWRFRHLRTVQRTIGFTTGTGGARRRRLPHAARWT